MSAEQRARAAGQARITQVTVAGDYIAQQPEAVPAPSAAPGLPAPPAALVGRDGSVKALTDLLDEGGAGAPVTVVAGLPGVGKSALAVATSHRVLEYGWFEERVFFLQLHGYAPNGAVGGPQAVREMLRYLGVGDADVPTSPEGQVALYRARLASLARSGRRVLIVADDAGTVSQVQDLVPPDGTHRLLVTSRHRLVAPGFAARVVGLEELAVEPAVELIAGAMLRTWPEDPRPAREPEALAGIAEHCGRLPLALTVAGALLAGDPGLAAGELARELAEARTRLGKLHVEGDVPVGVRAAFDLSYARLPADQARIFRLLAVVPGPDCSTALAWVLAGHEGVSSAGTPAEVRPSLAALAGASLLSEQPVGAGRWRMHDLVRLYARGRAEECAQEDGREEALKRLMGALLGTTRRTVRSLGIGAVKAEAEDGELPPMAVSLHWLDEERAVLVAAVGWASEAGWPDAAFALADALGPYLVVYGHARDAVMVARQALDVARATGDRLLTGNMLVNLGSALHEAWQAEEAIEPLTEALAVFREVEVRQGQANALHILCAVFRKTGRLEEARARGEEALKIFRELGNRQGEGFALFHLASALDSLGKQPEAVDLCRQMVSCMRETGDLHREASGLHLLARVLRVAGDREESQAVWEEALSMMRGLKRSTAEAHALAGLAKALLDEGRLTEARVRYIEALVLFEATGDQRSTAVTTGVLGAICLLEHQFTEALESYERMVSLLAGTEERGAEARAEMGRAAALLGLRRPAESVEAFDRAAALFALAGDAEGEAEARADAGRLRVFAEAAPPRRWWQRFRR